jgi:hypothetical protein
MSNTIVLEEPQVDTLMAAWTGLQLERGVNATNLASFSIVTQIPYFPHQTTYVYSDATGTASDWYRTVRYAPGGILGNYSQPWPVVAAPFTTGDGARRSLKNLRRVLARKLGSLQVVTTSSDGDPGGTTLVSTGMANQLDSNRYRGWWVMPTDGVSAGQIRSIGENALNPITGTLVIGPSMTSQIVAGTQVELHKLLSPDDAAGPTIGLRQALNLALAECWVLDRLGMASTGGITYDLASLGDWTDADAIREVYGPVMAGIPLQPFGGFTARQDAELVALDIIGFATGASMTIETTRPGDSYMKVGGVWTDQSQGFVYDEDESLFQAAFLSEIALAHCYEALANAAIGVQATRYQAKADGARRGANIMKWRVLPHPPERSHSGYTVWDNNWTSWVK